MAPKIYNTPEEYVAGIRANLDLRSNDEADIIIAYVDMPEQHRGPDGDPLRGRIGKTRTSVFAANGHALAAHYGGLAPLMSAKVTYEKYELAYRFTHPVVEAVSGYALAPVPIVVLYAGIVEWESNLLCSQFVKARFPDAEIHLVTCTCGEALKLVRLEASPMAHKVQSLVFTEECCGGQALHQIRDAYTSVQK